MKVILRAILITLVGVLAVVAQQNVSVSYQAISWSPDGQYLAFTRLEMTDSLPRKASAHVYIMKADGTEMRRITNDERNEIAPSWSKDGKSIFFGGFVTGGKDGDIYAIKRDGSALKQLTRNYGINSVPMVSRDGKKVVFNSETIPRKPQIVVMKADGSDMKALTTDNSLAFYNPQWSPDGKRIVYYIERGDKKDQIWLMNADGTQQRLLTNNIGHNFYPSWSADGKRIIFCSNRDGEEQVIYSMKTDGLDVKRLMAQNSFYARFSPNGKKLAFITGTFPNTAIYVANVDGTNQIKITP